MPEIQMLKVLANPFGAGLDHEGRTCCAVKYEPANAASDAHLPFLGVHLKATAKAPGDPRVPAPGTLVHHIVRAGVSKEHLVDWDHVWEYETEPTSVPDTRYYRDLLTQCGHHGPALLPADEATYRIVHGTLTGYRDARARLHQYVTERGATPGLRPTAAVMEAHQAKHGDKAAQVPLERDRDAEWMAFVGPALEAEKKAADAKAKAEAEAAKAKADAEAAAQQASQAQTSPYATHSSAQE